MSAASKAVIERDAICAVVGRNVKKFRLAKRLSQNDLADIAGVSRSYLVDLEAGRANPTIMIMDTFSFVLGVFVVDLLELDTFSAMK